MTSRHRLVLALTLIGLLGAFLRVYRIGWTLPNQYRTATGNSDESTAVSKLQEIHPSEGDFNYVTDRIPNSLSEGAFHFYVYCISLKLVSMTGWLTVTPSKEFYYEHIDEWGKFYLVGRLLSALFGLLSIPVCYWLGKKYASGAVGLLTGLFLATLPSHVVHSRYLIVNVPGLFWILVAFFCLLKTLQEGTTKSYVLSGGAIGIALAARLNAGPLLVMLPLVYLLAGQWKSDFKKLVLGTGCLVVAYLLGNPYILIEHAEFMKSMSALGDVVTSSRVSFLDKLSFANSAFANALGWPLWMISLVGVGWTLRRPRKKDWLLLSWLALLLLPIVRAGEMATPGRILPAVPFFVMAGSQWLTALKEKSVVLFSALLGTVLVSYIVFYGAFFRLLGQEDIRDEASRWIVDHIRPHATIGLLNEPSVLHSPGVIDRKFRHPEYQGLPDYRFLRLSGADWQKRVAHIHKISERNPEFIVFSDKEISSQEAEMLQQRLQTQYPYRLEQTFSRNFSFLRWKVSRRVPDMLYTPDRIYVFSRQPRKTTIR